MTTATWSNPFRGEWDLDLGDGRTAEVRARSGGRSGGHHRWVLTIWNDETPLHSQPLTDAKLGRLGPFPRKLADAAVAGWLAGVSR